MHKININILLTTIIISGFIISSCNNSSQNKEVSDADNGSQKTFASDDEFLDYIQKTHLNYMWDGAEPTSGLAPERMHVDGVYPQDDADVVTTGGSGFGIAGLIVGIERGFIPR